MHPATLAAGAEHPSQNNLSAAALAAPPGSALERTQAGPDLKPTAQALAEHFNQLAQQSARALHFSVDQDSEQIVIKVMDSATGQIIRQIPSEEMLRLARELDSSKLPALVQHEA